MHSPADLLRRNRAAAELGDRNDLLHRVGQEHLVGQLHCVEREAKLDYAAVLIPTNARSFVHVTLVIFDTKNEAEARRAYDASRLLVQEAASHGYGEYRAHLDFMDIAAEQYSFGDHAYMRFVETVKDAVDPNGILSPGKQGIWPRSMREARPGS